MKIQAILAVLPFALLSPNVGAQHSFPSPLDAARDIRPLQHAALAEEYIWTDGEVNALRADRSRHPWNRPELRAEPRWFRAHFAVDSIPQRATLYVAGPRDAQVFFNGKELADFSSDVDAPIGFRVFHAEAAALLHKGDNVIAICAIRGRGIVSGDASPVSQQITYGEVLAVKLVASGWGREGKTLLVSNRSWHSVSASAPGTASATTWQNAAFDDASWPAVVSLGGVESNRDLMQWSADAGMYAWPGYAGISSPLGTYSLPPVQITHVFAGGAQFQGLDEMKSAVPTRPFVISAAAWNSSDPTDGDAPALLLDFGREVVGRLLVESASASDSLLSVAYGESEIEALATGLTPGQRGGNYLGTNLLEVPANGVARGPKSAFRYVRIRFLRGFPRMAFRSIRVEGIAYPVTYLGSFESSDPLLDRIWETGAYTAHLCMQDDLWDAPKRDRGRWAGDIDVEGRVISTVFGDSALLERTLAALAPATATRFVNGIPGYSALWLTSLASLYAHSGNIDYVRSQHDAMLRVLAGMSASLNAEGVFSDPKKQWPFIDWSPGLYGATSEAIFGTNLQYIRGYEAAALLLDVLHDAPQAEASRRAAARLREHLLAAQPQAGATAFGRSWQINALAVTSAIAMQASSRQAIWDASLSHVKQDAPQDQVISPYFNATVLDAMASLGHARSALDWMRAYWGGMLAEGATSFWESYDLRWPKDSPHLSLQADGTSGYFVSLAHGWSSGPTAWLSEQVLGVRDPADGYRSVTIAPRLLGLSFVEGAVPTPHGLIRVSMSLLKGVETLKLELPPGIEHPMLSLGALRPDTSITLDGKEVAQNALPQLGTGSHTLVFKPLEP